MIRRTDAIVLLRSRFAAILLLLLGLSSGTAAQDTPPLPVDPTPLKELLSAEERSLVTGTRGNLRVVDVYLDISDKHLHAADSASDSGDFKAAERELDIYNKAVAEASNIAFSGNENRSKLGKRIEQRLYAQIRQLEVIDRRFPADSVGYPDAAVAHTRQLRAHALNQTLAVGQVLVESKDGKGQDGKNVQEEKKEKPEADPTAKPVANPPKKPQYFLAPAAAVRRVQLSGDYMTEQENEDVREAQEIDSRTKVFMKIASHRLALLTRSPEESDRKANKKPGKEPDQQEKDEAALAKLSRAELLRHYSRAIQETMDKLDDAHERNPKSGALNKALVTLRDSTDKQLSILHSLEATAKDQAEADALRQAVKDAEEANKGAHQALSGKS